MATREPSAAGASPFAPGNRAMLILYGRRFLVSITEAGDEQVRVTFPGEDYPLDGTRVELEFHDLDGFTQYDCEVLEPPREPGDGLLLSRPPEAMRNAHRRSWRVPADFDALIKSHIHPRRHESPVVNISAGGMLVRTYATVDLDDNVEVGFTLPSGGHELLTGRVVHIHRTEGAADQPAFVGIKFLTPDAASIRAIEHYLWERLRAAGPEGTPYRRRKTDRPGGAAAH